MHCGRFELSGASFWFFRRQSIDLSTTDEGLKMSVDYVGAIKLDQKSVEGEKKC